ncbi:UDP-N-acetylmuramoyl-L-alanyl-D-glutamate--2,6-diaminopimelate ligase [Allobacillus sp. GCM10007491]|uniref:UDP-N-acetylmuramoyl-L-alanyl-D-glutamate--2,6-diaminopimelate ligase n=1 Tax=Allobacillus saliphilus TaxID=2912308 RepID=A0A941CV56_9BACI|nr:UDP-N-acetylmuramoyl-L-alanyl-D-glutamate--2,6-diaminopimelate ligase [Allobacillus saliphilus]MBR7552795.1 UDP-N-acetylmuramoyl-L-alanyl-D-glutamate--2,6-diaminopimelate ligase [Allobacillus saliphilus]
MKLKELIDQLKIKEIKGEISDQTVHSIEMDSRKVSDHSLFICIDGFTVDGHDYTEQATRNGAIAIIAEKQVETSVPVIQVPDTSKAMAQLADYFYGHPSSQLNVIGVTGTNGKTTLTYLLDDIFTFYGHKTAVIGTIDMKIGDQRYPVKNTTPDALFLHKNFRKMVDENVETVIMEVSSHALSMGRVHGVDINTATYTNLTQDHLDYHTDMNDYAHAKSLLFSQLGNRFDDRKTAVINIDDPYAGVMGRACAQPIVTYGLSEKAFIRGTDLQLGADFSSFSVSSPAFTTKIETKLSGKFNVYNMLAAIAVAYTYNVPIETIKKALQQTKGVPGRFESVSNDYPVSVIVDYAHTPDSLENVLQSISEIKTNQVYTVVGSGGDRDRTKRPKMADAAMKYSDHVIFTSDNPRTEDPQAILDDMTNHLSEESFSVIEDRKTAIQYAIDRAVDGDIVLIAGKGHETYQEVNDVRNHFDDREVAKAMIEEKYEES